MFFHGVITFLCVGAFQSRHASRTQPESGNFTVAVTSIHFHTVRHSAGMGVGPILEAFDHTRYRHGASASLDSPRRGLWVTMFEVTAFCDPDHRMAGDTIGAGSGG